MTTNDVFSFFQPVPADLIFKKRDAQDLRLGDLVNDGRTALSASETQADFELKNSIAILGYPDDEGVGISKGRVGAALGPAAVRSPFYKMTPHLLATKELPRLLDFGDLLTAKAPLKERHEIAAKIVQTLFGHEMRVASIGGGHDYGYADGAGFLRTFQDPIERPLVINFDAHLDVRPTDHGLSSGTGFYRLLTEFEGKFDFAIVGVQSQCNSAAHYQWAIEKGARILTFDEILFSGAAPVQVFSRFFEQWLTKKRLTYLSVDIDAFSSAYAPGCSQSFATGFEPRDFFQILELVLKRWDVRHLGVYEVAPPLDTDNRTARLAAQILHSFVST